MLVAEADDQGADDAFLARQRHDKEGRQLVRGPRQRAQVLVGLGVVDLEAVSLQDRPCGQLVGGGRGHRAAIAATEGRARRVALVDQEHAGAVRVEHRADYVGETLELCVRVRRLREGGAEGAQVADLDGQSLRLAGEHVDPLLDPCRHRVEDLRQAADLVAALRRELLVAVAACDGRRRLGELSQRLTDGVRHDGPRRARDEQGEDEGHERDGADLTERYHEHDERHDGDEYERRHQSVCTLQWVIRLIVPAAVPCALYRQAPRRLERGTTAAE